MRNTGGRLALTDRSETLSLENWRENVKREVHGLKFVGDGMQSSSNSCFSGLRKVESEAIY